MIYDCFSFFNELDVLDIRLRTLSPVVDRFVLVEATRTHSNLPKPLYFEQNRQRFAAHLDKIVHLVVDEYPEYRNSWTYENHQRNYISRALTRCNDDDIILVSDADEIPRPATLLKVLDYPGVTCLLQDLYFFYLNYVDTQHLVWSGGTKVLRYETIRRNLLDESYVLYSHETFPRYLNRGATMTKVRLYTDCWYVAHGGWHFSYLGGVDAIRSKFEAYSHQEFNTAETTDSDRLNRLIASGEDIFGRHDHKFVAVPVDDSFPEVVRYDLHGFKRLLRSENLVGPPRIARNRQHTTTVLKGYVKKLGGHTLRALFSHPGNR